MITSRNLVSACVVAGLLGGSAHAVTMATITVGNPGNAGEWSGEGYGGYGPDRICGAVDYTYNIARYEVTAGQYTEFLNAVAGVDSYGLYNQAMWSDSYGCKIERYDGAGTTTDPYLYRVAGDYANRPVNYVNWGDAARFSNWLHNGQGNGDTETGAYSLNGAVSDAALMAIDREADWTWAIASEDEWYKAAYHKNDGATGNYFSFPTSSDNFPSNDLDGSGNNATFYQNGYTIGSPYWRTEVGAHVNTESPYGAFDMAGNVWEWNDTVIKGLYRGLRGGAFTSYGALHALYRDFNVPSLENYKIGFRVTQVPEPTSIALLSLGGLAAARRRRSTPSESAG